VGDADYACGDIGACANLADEGVCDVTDKRDLVADLAICEAATPGWKVEEHIKTVVEIGEFDAFGVKREEDAVFCAAARTGWPHAIRRAKALEALAGQREFSSATLEMEVSAWHRSER
jgi:hypothetical protein